MTEEQASKITREQLYNEIWEISVAGVAKKYNANYNDLLKLCKEADVPVPPSGYWVKLQYGKPVVQLPLPESTIAEVTLPGNDKPKRIRKAVAEKSVEKALNHEDAPEKTPEDDSGNNSGDETGDNFDDAEDDYVSYWGVSGKHNTYKREKLYKEVWANPVVKVAAQYGVSDVAIHKICKKLNVPTPPLGYWAKVNAGAKVAKTPLPKTNGPTQITGAKTFEGVKEKIADPAKQPLEFLSDTEREKVLSAVKEIEMPAENAQLHKKIAAYRAVVREWNQKDRKSEGAQRKRDYNYSPPFLAGVISNESLPRVYRILDALFRHVEKLGGSVNDDLSLRVRNEHVRIEIAEGQDKVEHVITKQEAQALIKYRDEKRRSSWASEPQIRKYDYVFNGRLRINIRESRYFRDTDKINVESRLGEMLIEFYEESEAVRLDREAKEEEARKKAEAERRKEERRKKYNEEVERTIALENAALDYATACRIRAYVKAVETSCGQDGLDEETAAWVDWATKKADWFDPTVARDDELFGEREHEKSSSEKALKEIWR
ncbi:hypothetical protein [Propionispora hippei]|uniref:Uncharacterized protein n=1 Tax=Propionispora hippei DSM 15287 TaxID=1123003 RepID=A0A1M6GT35_9FIRM|nr:hypothetical protein [Propionispora hippei]SHJ13125.1 hypothetical protein SAMN02745170_01818 [Propionispora hippei DSM 15287]